MNLPKTKYGTQQPGKRSIFKANGSYDFLIATKAIRLHWIFPIDFNCFLNHHRGDGHLHRCNLQVKMIQVKLR